MTSKYSTRMGKLVRPDKLKCTRCWSWKEDEAFQERPSRTDRRGRGVTCGVCIEKNRARYKGSTRYSEEIEVDRVTRTPDQMGRAVPITAPWPTKVREV